MFLSRKPYCLLLFIVAISFGLVTWNILTIQHQDISVPSEFAEKETVRPANKVLQNIREDNNCEIDGLTESKVFIEEYKMVNAIKSEINLENYIKKCELIPPSKLPYNLTDLFGDPSVEQGVRKYVQDELLGGMRNGKFIDVGANDGEDISNTLVLERDYGWTGLLIEADPEIAKRLLNKNRKSWVANVCAGIHYRPYKTTMHRHKDWSLVGRLDNSPYDKDGDKWTSFEVKCLPLYQMMKVLNLIHIDYLSMDIEGVELGVLKTLPFDKIFVKVFSIETMPNTWASVRNFMKSKGYKFVKEIRGKFVEDDVFVHESLLKSKQ